MVELDGHLSGAQCGPDGIRCGMTDIASSDDYTPLPAPAPEPQPELRRNFLQRFAHNTAEFATGAWDGGVDTVKGAGQLGYDMFYGSSPFADEQTRAETRARARARKYALTHSKELITAIIAPYQQDLAAGRDGHAAGRAVFDGVTVILGGGVTGKAATTVESGASRVGGLSGRLATLAAEPERGSIRLPGGRGYRPAGGAADLDLDELAQLTYQHVGAGDVPGRPSLGEIRTVLDRGTPTSLTGQNAVQLDYRGVRVIINEDMPWRSTAYYPGQ